MTPFPKAGFFSFGKVMLGIGIGVAFILMAFQPFGTSSFQHPYKFWILAGYGLSVLVAGLSFHALTTPIIPRKVKDQWTVLHEVVFVFLTAIFCLSACYLYYTLVFSLTFSIPQFFSFLPYAAAVSLLPVAPYLIFIHYKYKETRYAQLQTNASTGQSEIVVTGSNKGEQLAVTPARLLYVRSNDNYVILHLLADGKVTKNMLRASLTQVSTQLGDTYSRCHRQYLVNERMIMAVTGNITNTKLHLKHTDQLVPVSRSKVTYYRGLVQ